jgi:hypothetical protein
VSHAPQRKEKNCLNCGATVVGRFCHVCGQENVVPKESFWKLVIHFFYDITHFDSNFFYTLKYLLFKPGFLSKEYLKGRRASYLNPVRMYVFTSAIFFLIFFLMYNSQKSQKAIFFEDKSLTHPERADKINDLQNELKKGEKDSSILIKEIELLKDTARTVTDQDLVKIAGKGLSLKINGKNYKTTAEYDSVQQSLDPLKRDGWFERLVTEKQIMFNTKYKGDPNEIFASLVEIYLHKLPYLLFVSLPLFAFILKLLYIRRKQFLYADHGIFSIHHYIFSFILLLFIFLFSAIRARPGFHWVQNIEIGLFIAWPAYLYMAMLNFYKQGWFKSFVKFFLLNILAFFSLLLLFVIFLFFSILQL